jgi:hypothetical protein
VPQIKILVSGRQKQQYDPTGVRYDGGSEKRNSNTVPLSVFLSNLVSTIAISYLKTLGRIHTGNPE